MDRTHRLIARGATLIGSLALVGLAGCGGGGSGEVSTGQGAAGAPAARSTATTTAATPDDPGASPVDGLDAAAFRDAVTAPLPAASRRKAGPTADQVTLADGRTVWRVRIPGDFPLRSAQATVTVGEHDLGAGASSPTLDALIAVTLDGDGLVDGAPVSYRWGQDPPVAAGSLEVVG